MEHIQHVIIAVFITVTSMIMATIILLVLRGKVLKYSLANPLRQSFHGTTVQSQEASFPS